MTGKNLLLLGLCLSSMFVKSIEIRLAATDLAGNSISTVAQGEQFFICVTVVGDQQGLGEPVVTHLEKLSQVIRHPVTTRITIVNGQQSIMRTYVYKVRFDNSGEYAIGPALYDLGGQVVRSSAIALSVNKGQPRAVSAESDPFVHVKIQKASVYMSEQVIVQVHVCYKKSVEHIMLEQWKVSNGRMVQLADPVQEYCFYDGKSWPCVTYTYVLYPAHAGECVVPEIHMHGEREKENAYGSFISHFFFGRERERITAHSAPAIIQVKPLPSWLSAGTCVGEFSCFDVQVDKKEIEPGTAATLTVTLVGNGDVQHDASYMILVPDGLKMYESKTSYALEQPFGFVKRTQEFIVQALHDGSFVIEPPPFIFFNPKTQKVETLSVKKLVLTAKKGAACAMNEHAGNNTSPAKGKKWPEIKYFWLVLIATILMLMLILGYFVRVFQPYIEKKIAYYALRRCVKKVLCTSDLLPLHAAWFVLFNKRLKTDEALVSLREAGRFLDDTVRDRWYTYVSTLEYTAFKLQDAQLFYDDIAAQTYYWITIFEGLL